MKRARSLKQLLIIAEECRLLGVDHVSLKQNIDSTLPGGRVTFQVPGAVAEFEREMLHERVKELFRITKLASVFEGHEELLGMTPD